MIDKTNIGDYAWANGRFGIIHDVVDDVVYLDLLILEPLEASPGHKQPYIGYSCPAEDVRIC